MKTKYFYNTVTREFCGTDEPLGDNFAFSYEEPPSATGSDEAILFKDGKWVIEKIAIEEPTISVEEQIEQLMKERARLMQEMQMHSLLDETEEAKECAKKVREIDIEVETLKPE
ncbi:hypothetical protein HX037_06305 [Ignatzschineria indica]|uniref:hypothetical protein n=1 Tax=Ignatzschineria indica TaxID=472583 RepID=UPI002577DFB2|nr:hypothetical protein [Ignatzschineria indica]MDM1545496.1 hypothetical protein [Ignatzschineria indica]